MRAVPGRSISLAVALAVAPAPVPTDAAPMLEATVVHVDDGDTIDVRVDGHVERVRYIGIDAPEIAHDAGSVSERGGEAATRLNVALVGGKRVRLELDREARDRYGRLLAYVWLGDTMANLEMVRRGYAQTLTIPPNTRYEEWFARAQDAALAARLGLWGDGDLAGPVSRASRRRPGRWRTSRPSVARRAAASEFEPRDDRRRKRPAREPMRTEPLPAGRRRPARAPDRGIGLPRRASRVAQRCRSFTRPAAPLPRARGPAVRPVRSRSWAGQPAPRAGAIPARCPGCLWEGR